MWVAVCRDCYGPVEDSSPVERVIGYGKTPNDALCAWQESHDEAHEVEWVLKDTLGDLARQVNEEAERQRGWMFRLWIGEDRVNLVSNLRLARHAEHLFSSVSHVVTSIKCGPAESLVQE
jgi:hypothetical protein